MDSQTKYSASMALEPALLQDLGLACLLVADLDERSFQYSWFEALWAFLRVLLQSRDA